MGKADIAVKNWLSDRERFADLFNGTVFGGRQVVLPEELEDMDRETDIIITDKGEKEHGVQRYRDLVKRWNHEILLAVLACEIQDKTHYAMPVRNMLQDSLTYTDQIRRLWRDRRCGKVSGRRGQERKGKAQGKTGHLSAEEYLSRFRKEDRIYPVITLVFYYDVKKWDGAVELYDMFRLDASLKKEILIKDYLPNYKINLLDAGSVEDVSRFQTDLQQVFGMLKYRGEKEKLQRYMQENRDYFGQVDVETYQALGAFLRSGKKLKEIVDSGEEEQIDMCKALDDIYADGVKAGEKRGENAGRIKEKLFIITKMIKEGMPVSVIKTCTEATDQEIEQARNEMKSK